MKHLILAAALAACGADTTGDLVDCPFGRCERPCTISPSSMGELPACTGTNDVGLFNGMKSVECETASVIEVEGQIGCCVDDESGPQGDSVLRFFECN